MRYTLLYFFCLISCFTFSQSSGSIILHDHAGAEALVEKHIYFNQEHNQLPGYRIQIIASSKLQDIKDAKSSFLTSYSDHTATIVFEAPNYKLRVGNYQNRIDANRDLQEILSSYPAAYICKDLINVSER